MKLRKTSPALEYVISRTEAGEVCCHVQRPGPGGRRTKLRHVRHHSPDGFEVGYGGSGPADLALSIAADLFQAPRTAAHYRFPRGRAADAWVLHQMLKERWLCGIRIGPGQAHTLDGGALYRWALEQRQRWAPAPEREEVRP